MDGSHKRLLALRVRVQREFQELPGLRLTRWQAARLWNLDVGECEQLLSGLVAAGVLCETPQGFAAGQYCRPIKSQPSL